MSARTISNDSSSPHNRAEKLSELRIGILSRLQRHCPQEFSEFERSLDIRSLRRVMQGLLDAQLVRHRRPDGREFTIEQKGAEVLEKLVELFRMAGWEKEAEDIVKTWT